MKRYFSLMLIFSLIFSAILPSIPTVSAASGEDAVTVYADGEYNVPFVILKDTNDEESMTNDYMKSPAKVTIKDGKQIVQVTLNNSSWWQYLKTQTTQPGSFTDDNFVDAELISEDDENDSRVVEFEVQDLDEILNAKIHVIVPFINYDNKYDICFDFDPSEIPLAPEAPEEEPGEEPEDLEIADGNYTIGLEALHATEEKASGMARYISNIASLSVQDGKTLLTLTLTDHETVTGLQVEKNGVLIEPAAEKIDKEANSREVTYELEKLTSIINARVQYTSGAHNGDQPLRLSFDKDSLQVVEEPVDTEDPEDPEKPETPIDIYEDGEYNVPFVILKDTNDEPSMTNDYMKSPAKVTIKDGKQIVQVTLNNSSWWQYLKTQTTQPGSFADDNFVDAKLISEDAENDSRVVKFEVQDLDEILNAKIHVIVPFINYDNKYDIRFDFDSENMELIEDQGEIEEPGEEEPGEEDPEKEPEIEVLDIEDGNYTIGFEALHATEDRASGMARYISETASLTVQDGKTLLTLTLTDHETVTGFQVENAGELIEPTAENIDEEANTREVTYELEELASIINARVQYTSGSHNGDQPLRLSFNKDSLQVVEESEEPDETEDPGENSPSEQTVKSGETVEIEANAKIQVEDSEIVIAAPADLPAGTKIKIEVETEDSIVTEGLKVAGEIVEVTLDFPEGEENYTGRFTLTLPYDSSEYEENEVDIYYYNETESVWEKQGGTVNSEDSTITVEVEHFSKYAVLAVNDTSGETEEPGETETPGESEEPEETEDPEDTEDTEKPETPIGKYENGEYGLPFVVWQADKDEVSVADDYLDHPAKLFVKDGKYTVQTTLKNSSWWQYFRVEFDGEFVDVVEVSKDTADDTSVVQFEVENIDEILNAKVHIIVTGIPGFVYDNHYDIRFNFDTSKIPVNETGEEPGETEEPDETEKPGETEEPDETEKPGGTEDPKDTDKPETPTSKYKDGEYDLPFIVWQANKDEVSVADNYLEHPAKLIVKDGKYFVQLTLKNSSWWQYFKVEFGGKFVDVTEVSRDTANDTSVVQFEVENIDDILNAKVHIIVTGIPGFEYDNKYDIRFNFNTSNIPVNEGFTPEDPEEDPKEDPKENPNGDLEEPEPNPDKPGLDDEPKLGEDDDQPKSGSNGNGGNPQTADTSKITLFALMILGSLIPLVIKLRKRFVSN